MGKRSQNGKYEKPIKLKSAHWTGMCNVNFGREAPESEELYHHMISGQRIQRKNVTSQ